MATPKFTDTIDARSVNPDALDTQIPLTHPVWAVVDRIYQDDDEHLLTYASDALQAVKAAMQSDNTGNMAALMGLLDIAQLHIDRTKGYIGDMVHVLSGDTLDGSRPF